MFDNLKTKIMKFTDLLTIAIPVYERKDFFLEALNSAINQTVKCNIIVIDNCSSHDYFKKICLEKKITYYRNDRNIGQDPNLNKCYKLPETEFVTLLCDDDILEPTYVSSFLDAWNKHQDIDIFYVDFNILWDKTKKLINHHHIIPFGYMENGLKVIEYGIKYRLGFPVICAAIKKEKFTGFYEDFHASNDWAWLYENVRDLKVFGDSNKLFQYREHEINDTKNPITRINCWLSIWYIYSEVLSKYTGNNEELKAALKKDITYSSLYLFMHIQKNYFKKIIKEKNRYSTFLYKKYNEVVLYKLLIQFPLYFRSKLFKVFLRLKWLK